MIYFLGGILIFVGAVVANHYIMADATKQLNDPEQLTNLKVASAKIASSLVFVFITNFLFVAALDLLSGWRKQIIVVYFTIYLAYFLVFLVVRYGTLTDLGLPSEYKNRFIFSSGLLIFGFIAVGYGMYMKV